MAKDTAVTTMIELPPSGVRETIALHQHTGRAVFVWGSPGLAKSATGAKVATDRDVAFVDVRLSMYAPTDVHGMPYRVEENGETVGVAFTPPKILPRDINERKVKVVQAAPTVISFAALNGKGSNGIHYVKNPTITVRAVEVPGGPKLKAEILEQGAQHFVVHLVDEDGFEREGKVYYTIEGKAEAIVAFEELNSAPLATQQAAYQFILDRRIGEYEVPDGVQLIAMGNLQTDKGLTYNQPLPLANRFIHVQMVSNFDEWLEWAIEALINPMVIGYLTNNKGDLDGFDSRTASRGFATPRSWEFVSDTLNAYANHPVKETVLAANICGAIGDGIGTKFKAFFMLKDKLPPIEDILTGKITALKEHKGNVAVAYSLVTSLLYQLRLEHIDLIKEGVAPTDNGKARTAWYNRFNNSVTFWLNNFAPEISVMGVKSMLTIHKLPVARRDLLPSIKKFSEEFSDMLEQ